jgi:hypothetical protein
MRLRQDVCQYSMRPIFAERVLDRATDLQQGMKAAILREIVERAKAPGVWVAEAVSRNSTVGCNNKSVDKFLDGAHGKITPLVFDAVIDLAVCGSERDHNPDHDRLKIIATEISEFFIHPDERASHIIPAFFQSPRAFVPSPFDYGELAMAIAWMQREATSLGTNGSLVFLGLDESFPLVHPQLAAATRHLLEGAVIRVELLLAADAAAAIRSVESFIASVPSALRGNIVFRPLPETLRQFVPRFVSYVYRQFATAVPDERVFIVRNDWNPVLKEPLTWVASHEHVQRLSRWLHSFWTEQPSGGSGTQSVMDRIATSGLGMRPTARAKAQSTTGTGEQERKLG